MQMSKNVNNDVSKDPPITDILRYYLFQATQAGTPSLAFLLKVV